MVLVTSTHHSADRPESGDDGYPLKLGDQARENAIYLDLNFGQVGRKTTSIELMLGVLQQVALRTLLKSSFRRPPQQKNSGNLKNKLSSQTLFHRILAIANRSVRLSLRE